MALQEEANTVHEHWKDLLRLSYCYVECIFGEVGYDEGDTDVESLQRLGGPRSFVVRL